MRKVHRFGTEDPTLTGTLITPSSWRVGKDLADRVLRESAHRRDPTVVDKMDDEEVRHKPTLSKHSPPSPSPSPHSSHFSSLGSHLSYQPHDSLEDDYHQRSPLLAGRGEYSPSGASTERCSLGAVKSGSGTGTTKEKDSDLSLEMSGHTDSNPRAAKLSADMTRLLEELETTSREMKRGYEGAGSRTAVTASEGSKGKVTSSTAFTGPAAKRSKYELGKPEWYDVQ